MIITRTRLILPLALAWIAPILHAEDAAGKPNIIVFFTDDHGYADLSCMGFEKDVKTPHLDRLAAECVRFTSGYITAPQCCPSRAGLLTGRDQNRFGLISNGHGPLPLEEKTIADRLGGAGYMTGMADDPVHLDGAYWDGSKNTPLNGEKGMLAEGGIRVPYLVRWKGTIPPVQVIDDPVTSLDVAATATAAAGISKPENFDGIDLTPILSKKQPFPDRALTWRFWRQSAIRNGDWKLLKFSDRAIYLFNLSKDPGEKNNLIADHPEIAAKLEAELATWNASLCAPDPGSL